MEYKEIAAKRRKKRKTYCFYAPFAPFRGYYLFPLCSLCCSLVSNLLPIRQSISHHSTKHLRLLRS